MAAREQPEVAFVLAGGASLGAIQVGMLRALYEHHLVPDSGLRRLISTHVDRRELGAMPIPLHVVAVDVVTGEELRLSHGPVLEAVLASAAVPGVLPPVRWQDRALMDGGVANNTPISHAVELGARRVYVLPTGHACALEKPPGGALGMALHAISLLTHYRLVADIERHRADTQLIVLPPPCPLRIQPIDFGHADELIGRAHEDARTFLQSGGEDRPAIHMRAHHHRAASRPAPRRRRSLARR